ncbi:MAG: phosphatase PAP2 family protein [Clostridia bacterium]
MEILRFFESIRNPFFDMFFLNVTKLGEETFFLLAGLILFWCINKKQGYYLLSVGFMGILINQFLKITFRIPRPWVKDPTLSVVEGAKKAAEGFSFPSGHTQMSVGSFGAVAKANRNRVLRIICVFICVLVPLSRMYLGVHTPLDVSMSAIIALCLVFALYPVVECFHSKKHMRLFFAAMTVLSVLYLAYVEFFPLSVDINDYNYISALKNAYKITGCILGLWCGYEIDRRFINFDTQAVWWVQIIKFILGVIPVLIIKEQLKGPLNILFEGTYIGDGVRYFLIALFICGIWPMTFKWFKKLGKN